MVFFFPVAAGGEPVVVLVEANRNAETLRCCALGMRRTGQYRDGMPPSGTAVSDNARRLQPSSDRSVSYLVASGIWSRQTAIPWSLPAFGPASVSRSAVCGANGFALIG